MSTRGGFAAGGPRSFSRCRLSGQTTPLGPDLDDNPDFDIDHA